MFCALYTLPYNVLRVRQVEGRRWRLPVVDLGGVYCLRRVEPVGRGSGTRGSWQHDSRSVTQYALHNPSRLLQKCLICTPHCYMWAYQGCQPLLIVGHLRGLGPFEHTPREPGASPLGRVVLLKMQGMM